MSDFDFRAGFESGVAWSQATTSRPGHDEAVQQPWDSHGAPGPRPSADFPAVDPARDLPAAVELLRADAVGRHPYDALLYGMAADVLEAFPEGATDPGWGEHGCPECGQQIEHVRAEHTRMEWEDGARWPQPCPGSFVQVAVSPPAQGPVETEAGRCPSCEHGREHHASDTGECWFSVTRGRPGTPVGCACAAWTAPAGPQAEGAGSTCPTCATRPVDLTTDQQAWHHHHCGDGCPGHWVHQSNPNPATCNTEEPSCR